MRVMIVDRIGILTVSAALALGPAVMAGPAAASAQSGGVSSSSSAHGRGLSAAEAGRGQAGVGVRDEPAPTYHPQDPADSLYRAAREALNGGDYRRAAQLFASVRERYRGSAYASDSYYWQAFALYRDGDTGSLRQGLEVLEEQGRRFPQAATRGDAEALATRIRGALARQGDAEAAADVTRQARGLVQSGRAGTAGQAANCPAEDDDERLAALNALLNMDADRAFPILKQVMQRRDSCSATLRRKAVFLLAQKQTPETEETLLQAVREDPDPEVRKQAVFWLSQVSTEKAVKALTDILSTSDDPALQGQAIFALSQQDSPEASRVLRDYVLRKGAPEDLRGKAIFWLGQRESPENAGFLRDLYGKLDSEALKEKVIFSLSQLGGSDNLGWLVGIARNGKESVGLRKKAIFWVGQSDGAIDQLASLYDGLKERELKQQVIFALSQRDEPAAVDKLMQIARSDSDPELRKKAIFWLGQSDDPRAAKFLLELING